MNEICLAGLAGESLANLASKQHFIRKTFVHAFSDTLMIDESILPNCTIDKNFTCITSSCEGVSFICHQSLERPVGYFHMV